MVYSRVAELWDGMGCSYNPLPLRATGIVSVKKAKEDSGVDSPQGPSGATDPPLALPDDDVFATGCIARIVKLEAVAKSASPRFILRVEGVARITLKSYLHRTPYRVAWVVHHTPPPAADTLSSTSQVREARREWMCWAPLVADHASGRGLQALCLHVQRLGEDLLAALKEHGRTVEAKMEAMDFAALRVCLIELCMLSWCDLLGHVFFLCLAPPETWKA